MALVVFLRGVNVGGHRTFRPSLVANQLSDFDVVNVGAAGTFVVRNRISQAKLRAELLRRLPFEAEVVICKGNDVLDLASGNPFAGQPTGPKIVRFVSILAKRGQPLPSTPLSLPSGGDWSLKILAMKDRFARASSHRWMWPQSLAEKKGVRPSEERCPDQTPLGRAIRLLFFLPAYATYPPSMVRLAPVIKPASSDAKYETRLATSDTSPIRFRGIRVFTMSA